MTSRIFAAQWRSRIVNRSRCTSRRARLTHGSRVPDRTSLPQPGRRPGSLPARAGPFGCSVPRRWSDASRSGAKSRRPRSQRSDASRSGARSRQPRSPPPTRTGTMGQESSSSVSSCISYGSSKAPIAMQQSSPSTVASGLQKRPWRCRLKPGSSRARLRRSRARILSRREGAGAAEPIQRLMRGRHEYLRAAEMERALTVQSLEHENRIRTSTRFHVARRVLPPE